MIGDIAPGRLRDEIARAWRRLPKDIPHRCLEAAFDPPLPEAAMNAVMASPRLEQRLADRIAERLQLRPPEAADFADPASRVLLLGREAVAEAGRLAGVIRHGDRIGRILLRGDRERIREAAGDQAFALALSAARVEEGGADGGPVDALIEDFRDSAPRCLIAWSAELPDSLGGWLRAILGLVPDNGAALGDRRDVEAAIRGAQAVVSAAEG